MKITNCCGPTPNTLLLIAVCPSPNAVLCIAGCPTPNVLVCIVGFPIPNDKWPSPYKYALLCKDTTRCHVPYKNPTSVGSTEYVSSIFSQNFEFRTTRHNLDGDFPHFHVCEGYKTTTLVAVWGLVIKPQKKKLFLRHCQKKKILFSCTLWCLIAGESNKMQQGGIIKIF